MILRNNLVIVLGIKLIFRILSNVFFPRQGRCGTMNERLCISVERPTLVLQKDGCFIALSRGNRSLKAQILVRTSSAVPGQVPVRQSNGKCDFHIELSLETTRIVVFRLQGTLVQALWKYAFLFSSERTRSSQC